MAMHVALLIASAVALLALGAIGHVALWVVPMNRLNALAIDHRLLRFYNRTTFLMMLAIPIAFAAAIGRDIFLEHRAIPWGPWAPPEPFGETLWTAAFQPYWFVCWVVGGWVLLVWLFRQRMAKRLPRLIANHTQCVDLAAAAGEKLAGSPRARLAARVPGNQALHLRIQTKEIRMPGLPEALDGFSIVHLSDLHMAEHLRRPFHDAVVRCANELDGDLVAITGDIVDRRACVEWVRHTLGKLRSRHGVHFVLGNHDHRTGDVQLVRDALTGCGLIDLGGSCRVLQHGGAQLLLAGNESPWEKPPLPPGELPLRPADPDVLSVLLAHSPDQIAWARRAGFKLMLAGHTHGGQGRLPWIGAVLCPCLTGVKYSAGVFDEPPTLMHVSRGVSGMMPVRLNCPPELTKLVLHPA